MNRIALLCSLLFACEAGASEASRPGEAAYASGNFDKAYELLSPVAEQGDADAQYLLGLMYANGHGVDQSFYEAGKMYRLAGNQGHSAAQVNLGSLFEVCRGNGACNFEAAAGWYRSAADQGDAIAQYNLGVMYGVGRGVPESEWTAKELFRKSAEQGYAPAQFNLAVTYERGLGGPLDRVAAYAWYGLAASGGYEDGTNGRARIAAALSAEDLSKAEKLSVILQESYSSTREKVSDTFL